MTPAALAAALLIGTAPVAVTVTGPERLHTVQAEVPDLTGTDWHVLEIRGDAVTIDPLPEVSFFEEGSFAAWAGCNRFRGAYTRDGAAITVPETVAGTMMACPAPFDTLERDLIAAMIAARGVALDGTTLVLTDAAGTTVLRLTPMAK